MTFSPIGASSADFCAPGWYFWHIFLGNPGLMLHDWQGYLAAVGLARMFPSRDSFKDEAWSHFLESCNFIIQKQW